MALCVVLAAAWAKASSASSLGITSGTYYTQCSIVDTGRGNSKEAGTGEKKKKKKKGNREGDSDR